MSEWLQAKQNFVGKLEGKTVIVHRDELVSSKHPMIKQWPKLFRAAKGTTGVEDMTAMPGMKRQRA